MRKVEILIVDDSPADRASMRIAFERTGFPLKLHFASSGQMALDLLKKQEGAQQIRPHLMMLDVKMPGMSGLELLSQIKRDSDLSLIPIIMFSGSDNPQDICTAYKNYASGYIRKPPDVEGLNEVATVLGRLCAGILLFAE